MYLDTSIIVKLFVREADSDSYGELVDGQAVSSSILAYTEVWSTFMAKERAGDLSPRLRRRACAAFERNVLEETLELVPMNAPLFKRANRIMEICHPRIPLRSLDALHLASADQIQDWPLATADQGMRDAARFLDYPLTPRSST